MNKGGRPSKYSEALVDAICGQVADGLSLVKVCEAEDMPNRATVNRWLAEHEAFRDKYARARDAQADKIFEECLEIADQYDTKIDVVEPDTVQRAKLRIDTRKWMAGKLRPKKYGERVQQEISGPGGGAIEIAALSEDERKARIAELLAKRNGSNPG